MRRFTFILILVTLVGGNGIFLFSRAPLEDVESLASGLLAPLQQAINQGATMAESAADTVRQAVALREENQQLRDRLQELWALEARAAQLERENSELRAELRYKQANPDKEILPAQVIGHDPLNLVKSITVTPGGDEGVRSGMTVVTPAGLVGKVLRTGPTIAQVLLITDTSSAINAVAGTSRAQGIVYGQRRSDRLVMRFIPQGDKISPGDQVFSSSMGGAFPPNILVGTVSVVNQNDVAMFQEAVIRPAVDFEHLERGNIITNFTPVQLERWNPRSERGNP